jgi:hypothetical protein
LSFYLLRLYFVLFTFRFIYKVLFTKDRQHRSHVTNNKGRQRREDDEKRLQVNEKWLWDDEKGLEMHLESLVRAFLLFFYCFQYTNIFFQLDYVTTNIDDASSPPTKADHDDESTRLGDGSGWAERAQTTCLALVGTSFLNIFLFFFTTNSTFLDFIYKLEPHTATRQNASTATATPTTMTTSHVGSSSVRSCQHTHHT